MKKLILIIVLFLVQKAQSQEGPPYQNNTPPPHSCSLYFSGPYTLSLPNCNVVWFCYDASGNRVVRFVPICTPSGGGNFGNAQMLTKLAEDSSSVLMQLEATLVYPNPTLGSTTLEFEKEIENAEILLIDMQGRALSRQTFSGKKTSVDLSGLSGGNYYIVISRNQTKVKKPIVKVD